MDKLTKKIKPLKDKLMSVSLSLSAWTGEKIDHATSGEVDRQKKTKRETAKVVKKLIPKDALAPIRSLDKYIRSVHDTFTMSIGTGQSVLPAKAYVSYRNKMIGMFDERGKLVEQFISTEYPKIRMKAAVDMGDMYDSDEFPEPADLRQRFRTDIEVTPLPDNHKLLELCEIPEEDRSLIYQDAESRADKRMDTIRREAFTKLMEPIAHMAKILKDDGRMHPSLFANVSEILDVAECFNLEGTDEFTSMIASVRRKLVGASLEDCRADKSMKEATAKKAAAAMEEIKDAMAGAFPAPNSTDKAVAA